MNDDIRKITPKDKDALLEMMRDFYSSSAVYTNGSEEIFFNDIETCLSNTPYLEGYVMTNSMEIQGYAFVAKSFSTEFGKPCIWIEDLYLKPQYRNLGLGKNFMQFITNKYPDCLFRLEVEEENVTAIRLYKKSGFTLLPYTELIK